MQTTTGTAAIPHCTGRKTYVHTMKVGRDEHEGIFFSVDDDAAKVYAERCNEDMRDATDAKVRTISLMRAVG